MRTVLACALVILLGGAPALAQAPAPSLNTEDDKTLYALGLLVCLVQTAVFTILFCVYIALHTEEPAHDAH